MRNPNRFTRKLTFITAATATAATVLLTGMPASHAATTLNLHNVNWGDVTVPGSTCHSTHPIKLHNHKGTGGKVNGFTLQVTDAAPTYGNLTGDTNPEAVLPVNCDTGGGTAASQVKFTAVVYTAHSNTLHTIGVISARHQWPGTHPALLEDLAVTGHAATLNEAIYGPADADCCPSFVAHDRWTVSNGHLHAHSTLVGNDNLMRPTALGHATLGETIAALDKTYSNTTAISKPSSTCRIYTAGAAADQFASDDVPFAMAIRNNRITALQPNSQNTVTTEGIGQYSSLATIRSAYPHTQTHTSNGKLQWVRVHLTHSWLLIKMAHDTLDGHINYYAANPATLHKSKPAFSNALC